MDVAAGMYQVESPLLFAVQVLVEIVALAVVMESPFLLVEPPQFVVTEVACLVELKLTIPMVEVVVLVVVKELPLLVVELPLFVVTEAKISVEVSLSTVEVQGLETEEGVEVEVETKQCSRPIRVRSFDIVSFLVAL